MHLGCRGRLCNNCWRSCGDNTLSASCPEQSFNQCVPRLGQPTRPWHKPAPFARAVGGSRQCSLLLLTIADSQRTAGKLEHCQSLAISTPSETMTSPSVGKIYCCCQSASPLCCCNRLRIERTSGCRQCSCRLARHNDQPLRCWLKAQQRIVDADRKSVSSMQPTPLNSTPRRWR